MNKIHPSIQLLCGANNRQGRPNPTQGETYLSVTERLIDDNDTQEQDDTLKRIKEHPRLTRQLITHRATKTVLTTTACQ